MTRERNGRLGEEGIIIIFAKELRINNYNIKYRAYRVFTKKNRTVIDFEPLNE